jgi:hypothetical protein
MSKIQIQRVVKPLDLGEYGDEYKGVKIWVWVNPPRSRRREHDEIAARLEENLATLNKHRIYTELVEKIDGLAKLPESEETTKAVHILQIELEKYQDAELDEARLKEVGEALESCNTELYDWLANIWSQHKKADPENDDEYYWTSSDVNDFARECINADPKLWTFARFMTIGLMNDYVRQSTKKERRRSPRRRRARRSKKN